MEPEASVFVYLYLYTRSYSFTTWPPQPFSTSLPSGASLPSSCVPSFPPSLSPSCLSLLITFPYFLVLLLSCVSLCLSLSPSFSGRQLEIIWVCILVMLSPILPARRFECPPPAGSMGKGLKPRLPGGWLVGWLVRNVKVAPLPP